MGTAVRLDDAGIRVILSGWDRALTLRRVVEFDRASIKAAFVAERSSLEALIDSRVLGWGTHNGSGRPNRRRVGIMLGRAVTGKQLWVVPGGEGSQRLLVLDLLDHEFSRAVLEVAEPEAAAMALTHDP